MALFIYKGNQVEVVEQMSNGLWIWRNGTDGGQGSEHEFAPIASPPHSYSNVNPNLLRLNPAPGSEVLEAEVIEDPAPQSNPSVRLHVNDCSVAEMAAAVKGIGKGFASRILKRKPETGYRDWDHLISLNDDLALNWGEIKSSSLSFVEF